MENIILLAREMGKAIQQSEAYKNLRAASEANDKDKTLQDGIGQFNLKRMALNEEMQKTERDEAKIQSLNRELQQIYTDVMGTPSMMAYQIAKQEIDEMMQQITGILSLCVNGEDPDTCEVPVACGGSCDSCAGCH